MGEFRQLILNTDTQLEGCGAFRLLLEEDYNVKQYIPKFQPRASDKFNRNKRGFVSEGSVISKEICGAVREYNKKPKKREHTNNAQLIANQLLKSPATYNCLRALIKEYLPEDDDGKAIKTISLLRDVSIFIARACTLPISGQPMMNGFVLLFEVFRWIKDELCPFVDACGGWGVVLEKTWAFMKNHSTELIVGGLVLGGLAILGGLLYAANKETATNNKPNKHRK